MKAKSCQRAGVARSAQVRKPSCPITLQRDFCPFVARSFMMQPTRLGPRKTVQLLVALTILAWATQTLFAQWGFGQTTKPSETIVEVRVEAIIDGTDVTLKDLCRWQNQPNIDQHGGTIVAKLSKDEPVKQIGIAQIRKSLEEAGVNLTQIELSGSATCAVRRSEVDDQQFARLLEQSGTIEEPADEPMTVEETAQVVENPAFEPQNELKPFVPAVVIAPPAVALPATKPVLRTQLVLTRSLSAGQK